MALRDWLFKSTSYQVSNSKVNREYGLLPGYFSSNFTENEHNRYMNVRLQMNDGTEDKSHKQFWVDFDRFYSVDLENELPSGRHYIFMCRPDLYLVNSDLCTDGKITLSSESRVHVDPYFTYLAQWHPEIIASLTSDFAGLKSSNTSIDGTPLPLHSFMPYITTRVESLQLPDYSIKQNAIVQPYTKYTIPYTTSAIESLTGGSFDLSFREDKYYSIHKLFYAWIYYQDKVMRNIFRPKDRYLQYNALDYATSIYDFIVDETGENIVYWAKYTGCVPTAVPMSDLSFNRNSGAETKTSITFSYFVCEQMDRYILMDFQYNSLGYTAMNGAFKDKKLNPFDYTKHTVPIYNADTFLGKNFVGRPVIFHCKTDKGNVFKLRWLYN